MSIIKNALDNRQIVLTLTFLIFCFGIYSLLTMPRREDPKFNIRQGLIVMAYPGSSAQTIEKQVVSPVEDVLFSFDEVRKDKTYSNARQGVGYIVVELESAVTNADVFWSKLQQKLTVLKLSNLPSGVIGPIVESDFGDTIALLVGFQSDQRDSRELNAYMNLLGDRLRGISSLSKIKNMGNEEECFFINLDNNKLSQYNIYLPQILLALKGENNTLPAGAIEVNGLSLKLTNSKTYNGQQDIENQAIGIGPTGSVVYLKDIADVVRGTKERTQMVRVNGVSTTLISLEMHNGYNIVDFGNEVQATIEAFKQDIPKDISIIDIVNQPSNVKESINDFIREFFIAIVSVIVVILLLLPFRVAVIAAAAIPVTVAFTFAILDTASIQLQQVSLAALIVVLGMLVDDAIVIADNYVEKLDEGIDNYTAAWQSAEQLKVPMFTAGLTIVGAFAPLLFLSGYVGEFIESLPITITIAINASLIVAMFLTPYLCYTFIKKGLQSSTKAKRTSFLDYLQKGFDSALSYAFNYPKTIMTFSILTVIIGASLFLLLNQKLFPAAERDQFVIELRSREGTSLSQMNDYTIEVETLISKDSRLKNYATFIGTSAPRFYYNYAQKFPQTNLAQILVNTHDNEETDTWVSDLESNLKGQFSNLDVVVKKMQQGPSIEAPVEIRISGPDVQTLELLGDSIAKKLRQVSTSSHVVSDFYEKQLGLEITTNTNAINQLGITDAIISQELAIAYDGLPMGTVYEGETPTSIILQKSVDQTNDLEGLDNFYVTSPLTGASFRLSEVANINPIWRYSNLKRRNGIPTLTIQSQAASNVLPSKILDGISDELEAMALPQGYRLSIGGEDENQRETFKEMSKVMVISVFLIFIIILIQFKNIKQVFIVLAAIPLSLFGATFGLLLSGYPFGFTAFIGLASLVGVSVRNSIILVDFANELVSKNGMSTKEAAFAAGKRRIRPIFLTTMAAAIGVTPMIISGSPLWAPLATVLAVGLIFSMVMTLITVPVLYWKFGAIVSSKVKGSLTAVLLICGLVVSNTLKAQDIPLTSCIELAKQNNKDLQLLTLELQKKQLEIDQVNSNLLPKVMLDGGYFWYYNSQRTTDVEISLTDIPLIGGIPPIGLGTEFSVPSDNRFMGVANLGIYQPITQLFKINRGASIKQKEWALTQLEYLEAISKIEEGVAKLYMGIVIEDVKIESIESQIKNIGEHSRQVSNAVEQGLVLNAFELGMKADVLDHKTRLSKARTARKTYQMHLNQLLGVKNDSIWNVKDVDVDRLGLQQLLEMANDSNQQHLNFQLQKAKINSTMAEDGLQYSKSQLIPDLTFTGQYFYLENVPLVPKNNVFVGLTLSWPILQWGKNQMDVELSRLKIQQSLIQTDLAKESATIDIKTKALELQNALEMLNTAEQAYKFREEELRIKSDGYTNGLISFKDYSESQKDHLETYTLLMEAKANIIIQTYGLKNLLGM